MTNEKEFIKGIWNKYDKYQQRHFKDVFFEKKISKNSRLLQLKVAVMLVLSICLVGGGGYASYKYFIEDKPSETYTENWNYIDNNMIFDNDYVYYKILNSYEEYLDAKEQLTNNIIDVTEKEFENNIVIILGIKNKEMKTLYLKNITADETTLYIECSHEKKDKNINIISTVCSRDLLRDSVDVIMYYENIKNSSYIDLKELPQNYSKEDAIRDNCFVIENHEIISDDKQQMDNFILETESTKKDNMIRIYEIQDEKVIITDIVYKSGLYFWYHDSTRTGSSRIISRMGCRVKKILLAQGTPNEIIEYGFKVGNVGWEDGVFGTSTSMYYTLCLVKNNF